MELAARRPSGTLNFEVASIFLQNLCTLKDSVRTAQQTQSFQLQKKII